MPPTVVGPRFATPVPNSAIFSIDCCPQCADNVVVFAPRRISRKAPGGVIFYASGTFFSLFSLCLAITYAISRLKCGLGSVTAPAKWIIVRSRWILVFDLTEDDMANEPEYPRAVAFFDGQNLFYGAKEAFGYSFPNYDARALADAVCDLRGWELMGVRFYTGIHDQQHDLPKYTFWSNKLASMKRNGVSCFAPTLRYRPRTILNGEGRLETKMVGVEKGVDVRIALDIVRLARKRVFDVAVVFSQDQDLAEAAREIREIARDQDRWIKIACAFPCSATTTNRRGINGTDWIQIDRYLYDQCIDPTDFRPAAAGD